MNLQRLRTPSYALLSLMCGIAATQAMPAVASAQYGISYGNGAIMTNQPTVYLIYYGSFTSSEKSVLEEFVGGLGGSEWYRSVTLYPNASGAKPKNGLKWGGSTTYGGGSYTKGYSLTYNDITTIVRDTVPSTFAASSDAIYLVLTDKNVHVSGTSSTSPNDKFCEYALSPGVPFCGYHNHITIGTTDIKFGMIGDPTTICTNSLVGSCGNVIQPTANGVGSADAMVGTIAHEIVETITDPAVTGGYRDSSGNECADKCSSAGPGTTYTLSNGAPANLKLGNRDFLIPQNWLNVAPSGRCDQAWHGGNLYGKSISVGTWSDHLEVYYTGEFDTLYHTWRSGSSWSGEYVLETTLNKAKDIVSITNSDNNMEVFYIGTDNYLYHTQYLSGVWLQESRLGTNDHQAAKLVVGKNPSDNRLEVFYIGTNGVLYHNWQTTRGFLNLWNWNGEAALSSAGVKRVDVLPNSGGKLTVVYTKTNDQIAHMSQWASGSGGWTSETVLPSYAKEIALGANSSGSLELVYIGTNNVLYHRYQTGITNGVINWSGDAYLGTSTNAGKALAVARNQGGALEVVYIGTNDVIYHNYQDPSGPGGWHGELPLGDSTKSAKKIGLGKNSNGTLEVFYVGMDNLLRHVWQDSSRNGGWSVDTMLTN